MVEALPSETPEETGNSNNNCSDSCKTFQTDENKLKTLKGWTESFAGNFHDLFDETAGLLMVGLLISGLIDFLIPVGFFQREIFSGFFS